MAHRVTFIRGDGTGPGDLRGRLRRVLEGTGVEFEWDWQDAGTDVYEEEGTPLPDRVLESIKENKVAIKGPITTPVGSGFRSINVALRKQLDLYACLRPCKKLRGRAHASSRRGRRPRHRPREPRGPVRGRRVREGHEKTDKLRKFIKDTEGTELREDIGVTIKAISVFGTQRIVRRGVRVREGLRPQEGHRSCTRPTS